MRLYLCVSLALLLLLGAGCGPGISDAEEAGGGGSQGGSTSRDATEAGGSSAGATCTAAECFSDCRCFRQSGEESLPELCPAELICDRINLTCNRPRDLYGCYDMAEYAMDPAALECVLLALRDRRPGRLEIEGETVAFGLEGSAHGLHLLQVVDEARLIVTEGSYDPFDDLFGAPHVTALASPEVFDACLAYTDVVDRYACLFDALAEGEALSVCADN